MKAVKTIILILVSSIVFGQGTNTFISFKFDSEVKEAVNYLNEFREDPTYASVKTKQVLKNNDAKHKLTIDKDLTFLAKLRVREMISNNVLSHNTKYDIDSYGEVASYNGQTFDLKDNIHQFIESEGHREILMYDKQFNKIGYAAAVHDGLLWVCAILSE